MESVFPIYTYFPQKGVPILKLFLMPNMIKYFKNYVTNLILVKDLYFKICIFEKLIFSCFNLLVLFLKYIHNREVAKMERI